MVAQRLTVVSIDSKEQSVSSLTPMEKKSGEEKAAASMPKQSTD